MNRDVRAALSASLLSLVLIWPAVAETAQSTHATVPAPNWTSLNSLSADDADLSRRSLEKFWECVEDGKATPTCAKAEAVMIEISSGQHLLLLRAPPYGSCGDYWYAVVPRSSPNGVTPLACGADLEVEKMPGQETPAFLVNGVREPDIAHGGMNCVVKRFRWKADRWIGEKVRDCH